MESSDERKAFEKEVENHLRQMKIEMQKKSQQEEEAKRKRGGGGGLEHQIDVKAVQKLFEDCFALPKIELHAHIGGCLRAETFLQLSGEREIDIDHIDFYNVDVAMAFEIFKAVGLVLTDLNILERVVREIIEDYAKYNCVYLELRSTPKSFTDKWNPGSKTSMEDYIDRVLKVLKEADEVMGDKIKVRYIASVNRSAPVEHAQQIIDLAIKYKTEK